MSIDRTRRPIGCRQDPDGPDPQTNVATFLYREDAVAATKGIAGYVFDILYSGYWDRWFVEARRKSWPIGKHVTLQKYGKLLKGN